MLYDSAKPRNERVMTLQEAAARLIITVGASGNRGAPAVCKVHAAGGPGARKAGAVRGDQLRVELRCSEETRGLPRQLSLRAPIPWRKEASSGQGPRGQTADH